MEGWMEWFCGSVRAVRCRVSVQRFFLRFTGLDGSWRFGSGFRFAVRFAAFLHQHLTFGRFQNLDRLEACIAVLSITMVGAAGSALPQD